MVVIDGTSGAGGLPLDTSQADAYYFAPQKSFGSDGGLWLALLSPAAAGARRRDRRVGRFIPAFCRLRARSRTRPAEQTQNTPAIATLYLMRSRSLDARAGRACWCVERTRESSGHLYGWAEEHELATRFVAEAKYRSLVVGARSTSTRPLDAGAVAATLARTGFVRRRALPQTGSGNQLRIAMSRRSSPTTCAR